MFTSSPAARTWSTPPKPISYAQPSPPKIQIDFLARNSLFARTSALVGQSQSSFSSSATTALAAAPFFSPSSFVAIKSAIAAFTLSGAFSLAAICSSSPISLARIAFWPRYIPYPCSALSSNSELAHAGPWPSLFVVYGDVAAGPPQIEEQPVALEMYILSPKSWVIRRA